MRFGAQFVLDAVAWAGALVLAVVFRYEFMLAEIGWNALFGLVILAIVL
ncbi:MAG: polysaccharide biosynthesis protein, partial [Mycetocola sp.]|nr:polysaccharide biosynthesis protein [Mycetocola sp.]